MRVLAIVSSLILLGAVSASAGARVDRRAAEKASFVPTGETRTCLPLTAINQTHVRDDSTIDYELNNGQVWRNTLPGGCPGLGSEERFLFKTSTSEVCSVDTVTVLQSAGAGLMQGATCGLGEFERVRKKAG